MQLDLSTLYYLTMGTLAIAVAMTLWERQVHSRRAKELGFWAIGYGAFALGCLVILNRRCFPGAVGLAMANVVFVLGYLMVLHGAICLDRPTVRTRWYAVPVAGLIVLWAIFGSRFPQALWVYVASLPIALVCGLIAWSLLGSHAVRHLRSRPVAVAISAGHGLFYLGRAVAVPVLVARYGDRMVNLQAQITMYEAVLFSVAMPTAFLALVREEAQILLLTSSRTDYLTGLPNRQAFFLHGARILAESGMTQPVSLLAFDLDHFKAINDHYGHAAGDEVLKLFADVARDVAGPEAILVRLGGEEFAALLPGSGSRAAQQVGQRLAARFAEAAACRDGLGIPATVSIGLAAAQTARGDLAQLLASADRALYRAKALGRNRIEKAEEDFVAVAA